MEALALMERARVRLAATAKTLQALPEHQTKRKDALTWACMAGEGCRFAAETLAERMRELQGDLRATEKTLAQDALRMARGTARTRRRMARDAAQPTMQELLAPIGPAFAALETKLVGILKKAAK